MKQGRGDWRQYRDSLEGPVIEVDFHRSDCGPREIPYEQAMSEVESDTLDALKRAFEMGLAHVIFSHGHSTSGPGRTTARSVVRGLMRGACATPYIVRRDCIQHYSVFVASIRPNPDAIAPKLTCPHCGSADTKTRPGAFAGYFKCRGCDHRFNWFDLDVRNEG